jgi:hypothetical protein
MYCTLAASGIISYRDSLVCARRLMPHIIPRDRQADSTHANIRYRVGGSVLQCGYDIHLHVYQNTNITPWEEQNLDSQYIRLLILVQT